jgi:dTDP-glucose 4,6-dehydratase
MNLRVSNSFTRMAVASLIAGSSVTHRKYMPRILVTGADGFIGSHLVEALVRAGRGVRAVALYNSFGSRGWLDTLPADVMASCEVILSDVRDSHGMRMALTGCDSALHLAALIGIPYSYHAPESYVDVNVRGTLNIVQAARDLGVSKVVVTSTSEVYGSAQFVPITEEHPLVGQSPYSATKIGADQIAMSYFRSFGTPVSIARPFNTYGPRQSTRAVIPTVITQMLAGNATIKLGALKPTRDFNFVEDTVRGLIAVHDSKASVGEVINLGSGYEISVQDTVSLIADVMGRNVAIESDEERVRPPGSEVERLWADNGKARRLLGWQPSYGGIEGLRRGVAVTAQWFSDPGNRAHYRSDGYAI